MTRTTAPGATTEMAVRPGAWTAPSPQRGFGIIELMIGMVVGLTATLVVMQTLAYTGERQRTTVAGSSAQVNGALALYTLEREAAMAGYGLTTEAGARGCPIRMSVNGVTQTLSLNSIAITDGGGIAPDTIRFMSSDKPFSLPAQITVDHPPQAANFFVNSVLGIAQSDLLLAVPDPITANNWCTLVQVTNDPGTSKGNGGGQGQNQVIHNSGLSIYNQPGGQNIFPPGGYPAGSYLLNLGQFIQRTYSIDGGENLQMSSFNIASGAASAATTLYPHIVNLQALYGKDTDGDEVVDTYDNATPTTNAGWLQVKAVRIAILARSAQWERDVVTAAAPSWDPDGQGATGLVDGDLVDDWNHYRYRLFQVTVPLRNEIWSS